MQLVIRRLALALCPQQETLRCFAVDDELLRLPRVPTSSRVRESTCCLFALCPEQETLRGFAVDDELLRLPHVLHDDPEQRQGLDLLMECYINRMEDTMTKWYTNILKVDMEVGKERNSKHGGRVP